MFLDNRHWLHKLLVDFIIILLGVALTWLIAETQVFGALDTIINMSYAAAALAGLFFVSIFTIAPAAYILFKLAGTQSLWPVAVLAGLGAAAGDVVIYWFARYRLARDLAAVISPRARRLIARAEKQVFFRWLMAVLGVLIVASPIPDELGITLVGFARMKMKYFAPAAFVLNVIGIYLVLLASQAWSRP